MKKIISLSLVIAMVLAFAPVSSAFNDIEEPIAKMAAEGLASIGIIASVDNFYPKMNLSRAQFCKMAVLSAGFDESTTYSSYTLYPDVLSGQWYTPFVNAAVKKYSIIKAYPSGYFGPNDDITYGQAVTILLRMMGWKDEEVGAFWPRDFVLKAKEIGLTNGMKELAQNDAIPREQAAILINNMLLMNGKDGTPFANKGFVATKDSVLLATSFTDASLKQGEVSIWNGEKSTVYTGVNMPESLIGTYGTAIFDKKNPSQLKGFIADTNGASSVIVKGTESDGISTASGKVYVGKTVKVSNMGIVADYITSWFDIKPQSKAIIYRDEKGAIKFISAIGTATSQNAIIYGTESFTAQQGAKFIHNGATITQEQLQKYDVLTYSKTNNTYYVSDNRLVLQYTNSGPTFSNPTFIEAGGKKYNLSEQASSFFKDIKIGQVITILLDYNGNVCAAFPQLSSYAMAPKGILTKLTDTEFEVKLDSGFTLSGVPNLSEHQTMNVENSPVSVLYKSLGRFVTVNQTSTGKYSIRPVEMKRENLPYSNSLDLSNERVASNVKVYEQVGNEFPLHLITGKTISSVKLDDIVHTGLDRNGKINVIIANDITGDQYIYGLIKQGNETISVGTDFGGNTITREIFTITVKNSSGEKVFKTFSNPDVGFAEIPGAIAKDTFEGGKFTSAPTMKLKNIGSAKRDDFDSVKGVKVNGTYYEIHQDAQVYIESLTRFMTLSEARANFDKFELYGNKKVTMIVVKK